jgi:hypothetical protein
MVDLVDLVVVLQVDCKTAQLMQGAQELLAKVMPVVPI